MDLNHWLRVNNEAILLLVLYNDQEGALKELQKALHEIKTLVSRQRSSNETPRPHGNENGSSSLEIPSVDDLLIHHPKYHALPNLVDHHCYVFNNLLTFLVDQDRNSSSNNLNHPEPLRLHRHCAVIMLNIALILHQKAIEGDSSSWLRAERLYELVVKLLVNADDDSSSSAPAYRVGTCFLIMTAALNNLSQIRLQRAGVNVSQESFRHLGTLLFQARPHTMSAEEEVVFANMVLNIMVASSRHTAGAA